MDYLTLALRRQTTPQVEAVRQQAVASQARSLQGSGAGADFRDCYDTRY